MKQSQLKNAVTGPISGTSSPKALQEFACGISPWPTRTALNTNSWNSVCWSPELQLFCAVASTGTGNRVMTSPDGVHWTSRTSAADNEWRSVCWAKGINGPLGNFCAIASSGTYRSMTSADGITWGSPAPSLSVSYLWNSICFGSTGSPFYAPLLCATSISEVNPRIAVSTNGANWDLISPPNILPGGTQPGLYAVCYAPELGKFFALSKGITVPSAPYVYTSTNGYTWAVSYVPISGGSVIPGPIDTCYRSICWSPELHLLVAVGSNLTAGTIYITYSNDGVTWVTQMYPNEHTQLTSVCWSPELGLFCAVGETGVDRRVLTSSNGMDWVFRSSTPDVALKSVAWGGTPAVFCAVNGGTSATVLTSR